MRYIVDVNKKEYKKLIECIDCTYYREEYNDWDICSLYDMPRNEKDFCSKAKNREEGVTNKMKKYNKVAHPLKDVIKKKYKSLNNFCENTGIDCNTMYYFFRDRNHTLCDDTKMIICKALDIDIGELWEMLYG